MSTLEEVRDILIGARARELDARMKALEERVEQSLAALRAETVKRLDAVESHFRTANESLAREIRSGNSQRDKLASELRAALDAVRDDAESATGAWRAALARELEPAAREVSRDAVSDSDRARVAAALLALARRLQAGTPASPAA
jgi:hypothetical protein